MAAPTDEQRKALLILRVGEVTGGLLAANIDTLWDEYAAYATPNPALRDLYVKRGLIEIALGATRADVDFTDGDHSQRASQAAVMLLKMLDSTEAAIVECAALGQAGGAAIGELTTVTPSTPPRAPLVRPFGPDATDPAYWGDPYWPQSGRRVRP
jgi:hypothetical protein